MKSITIAAVRSADAAYRYADDGSGTIKSVEVAVLLTTGYGDKAITAEAICVAYGKAADALKEIDSEFIIVTGDVELPKGEAMRINNCRFYAGSMGLQLNQVSVAGNIGNEPEIQRFERGMVAKFSVAARRTKDVTDWFNCAIWGKQAEVVEKFVGKGNQIAVVGQLKLEQWNDKQTGALRTAYQFNMDRLTLLGKRAKETESEKATHSVYETYANDDF